MGTNIFSACHNGHKYEPLSIMHYEFDFDTKVGEFGCKAHSNFPFLRASPDGINIKRDNPRYGRALEIKNPVSRQLTGIPKYEYLIKLMLHLEVWDLDDCDFFETIFHEYLNDEDIYKLTAGKISENLVIGWFKGRMEWGPRALGNRSILANPMNKNIKDILNIKKNLDFI